MAKNMTVKKTRSSRTTPLQYTKMLDFFYLNKGLAEGKFNSIHGKEETQRKWTELSEELNNVQGATKTVEQWQMVWRDLKSRTSTKARDLRKAKAMTGNKSIKQSELSEMELRVIGIIGAEYVEGSKDCAENIPEEESLQNELICGNSMILEDIPRVINICNTFPQENFQEDLQTSNGNGINFLNTGTNTIDDCMFDENASDKENIPMQQNFNTDSETHRTVVSMDLERQTKRKTLNILSTSKPSDVLITARGIGSSASSRRYNKANRMRRSTEQLHSSKEQFVHIAEKQANAMMMLAEASKDYAKAARMNALAMTEMANAATVLAKNAEMQTVNDVDRIQVMKKVTQVLENLLPSYVYEEI